MPDEPVFVFINKGTKYIEEIHNLKILKKHTTNILQSFQETGELTTEDLRKKIYTGSRTGRVYNFRGQKHIASAPGEPPANRSGRLLNSFKYIRTALMLKIGSEAFSDDKAPYPFFLEVGTSKMKPRQYFIPTIEQRAEDLRNKLYRIAKES